MFNAAVPDSISAFGLYAKTFQELAARLPTFAGIDENDKELVVRMNKRLDNALFAIGQFLATYDY